MKKLVTLMLGMSLAFGTFAFAADEKPAEPAATEKKAKKAKKAKTGEEAKPAEAPAKK